MSTETKAPAPPRTRWSRTPTGMAAAAAGVLTSFGFAPLGIEPAGIAGIALLLAALRAPSVRSARWRFTTVLGMLFAAGFMGPLLWWMNAVSFGAYLVLVIAQAVFVTASVLALRAVIGFGGWPIWTACVWVGFEYLRSSLPFGGFPWGRLAYVVVDTPLESYARLVGTPSTSFVVFLTAALAACLFRRTTVRGRLGSLSAICVVFVVGIILPTGISGSAGSRTVAVVQGDVPVLFAPWPSGEIFQMHLEETQRLADAIDAGDEPAPDLILWPENSLDIDPYKDPGVSDRIEDMSRRLGAPILIGAILDGPTRGTAYNAGIVWSEDGPADKYIKRRVVPFGEYIPFRPALGRLVGRFDREVPRDMLGGTDDGAIDMAGVRVGDYLCWDIAYDGVVRDTINNGAQMLVVQTSNASFTGTAQPEQQWQISRLRAIETGRTVVVPSTNGISGIIEPTGNVAARTEAQTSAHLTENVVLGRGTTPGVRWGGWLQTAITLIGVGAFLARAARLFGRPARSGFHCDGKGARHQ